MDGNTIIYVLIGSCGIAAFGGIIYAIAQTGVDITVLLTGIQITFVAVALIVGGTYQLSDAEKGPSTVFNIATAVMLYLPISLAMFSIIGAAIFENANFLIPVIGAGAAVGMNLAIDSIVSKYGNAILNLLGSIFSRKAAATT